MGKQLKLTDPNSNQEYTLEFSRKTAKKALREGFDPNSEDDLEAIFMIPILFSNAFEMHHPNLSEEEKDAIYEMILDKTGLIEALGELFADPIEKLTADPKGAKSKNFKWKKTW